MLNGLRVYGTLLIKNIKGLNFNFKVSNSLLIIFTNIIFQGIALLVAATTGLAILSPSTVMATSQYTQTIAAPGNPPAGYLATPGSNAGGLAWMLDNAIKSDVATTTPGDYCNYYNVGDQLIRQNSYDQGTITGFHSTSPYSNWQEGDLGSNNVCQFEGGTWGFELTGALNNNCSLGSVCGMHHFDRISGNNFPWANYGTNSDGTGIGPNPALTFSTKVMPYTNNVTQGDDGYFCPIFLDTSNSNQNNYIEYCFVNWQKGSGFPAISQYDQIGTGGCGLVPGGNVATVYSAFNRNLTWSTERSGSTDTFGSTTTGYVTQTASITAQNLLSVINQIDSPAPIPNGCGWQLSKNVANYEVIGYEDGTEGGGFSVIGDSVTGENMQISTDSLFANDKLAPNTPVYSANFSPNVSGYQLWMQGDGNVCIYDANHNNPRCNGKYSPGAYLIMQSDGNLVEYQGTTAIWNSGTSGSPGAYMVMQGDGNLVVYKGNAALHAGF